MPDEIEINHRHDDGGRPMTRTDEDRIDGLVVRQFSCDCGYGAAVLSRLDDEEPGGSWPFTFGRRRETA